MIYFIILMVILVLLLITSTIFNFVLYNALNISVDKNEIYEGWILDINNLVKTTYNDAKALDESQMFMKDDEVGVIFEDLLNLIDNLHSKIEVLEPLSETATTITDNKT